jgi:hypothetical protein
VLDVMIVRKQGIRLLRMDVTRPLREFRVARPTCVTVEVDEPAMDKPTLKYDTYMLVVPWKPGWLAVYEKEEKVTQSG